MAWLQSRWHSFKRRGGGVPVGCIEVKCPYATRDMLLSKAVDEDKSFFLQSIDGTLQLKRNHAYYYQCQGAMNILSLPWIDFIVYTKLDLHVERIQRDTSFWDNRMVPELTDFFFKYILPTCNVICCLYCLTQLRRQHKVTFFNV